MSSDILKAYYRYWPHLPHVGDSLVVVRWLAIAELYTSTGTVQVTARREILQAVNDLTMAMLLCTYPEVMDILSTLY